MILTSYFSPNFYFGDLILEFFERPGISFIFFPSPMFYYKKFKHIAKLKEFSSEIYSYYLDLLLTFFFNLLAMLCGMCDLILQPGITDLNLCPLHWQCRVLTTGLPGKYLLLTFYSACSVTYPSIHPSI